MKEQVPHCKCPYCGHTIYEFKKDKNGKLICPLCKKRV